VTTPRPVCNVPASWPASRSGSRLIVIGLLLCLDWNAAASAQSKHAKPYALIFGTVWGPDNRPLYAVKVKIRRADQNKAKWELYSDHSGEFAQRVPTGPADYLVWADLKGYKSPNGRQLQPGDEVKVHIDNDERADIGLHLK
jgi:hypothetical protein